MSANWSPISNGGLIGNLDAVDIIEVRGMTDFFGRSYFVSNPNVSADFIAMLRYGSRRRSRLWS